MNAAVIDRNVVRSKLAAIERAQQTLQTVDPLTEARLTGDPIAAAAVERLLSRMVDLAAETNAHISAVLLQKAPDSYRDGFDLMQEAGVLTAELVERIKPSVGLRNTIVHQYIRIEYGIVAASVPRAIADFAEYRRQVAAFVAAQSPG